MSRSNRAAWITEPRAKPFQIKDAPFPAAGKGEVVIKNHAVAVNPVDWRVQDSGIFMRNYPTVLGTDVAGEVHEAGEGVTHVQKGDRVIGHAFSLVTNNPANGGFQLYTLCNALVVTKIPNNLPYTSAAVLPLAISTASALLFKKETLNLPPPTSFSNPSPNGKSVLIWGGSGSVGATAIQLATAAGIKVVTVSSPHNFDNLKRLGATAVFDYRSSTVAENVIAALADTDFAGICDTVGSPETAAAWAPVYKKLGGRYGSVRPGAEGVPEGIEGAGVFGPTVALADRYVGEAVWAKWVPTALEKGVLKALPEPIVLKGGLEAVQKGLVEQKKGVSFGKVVIEL